MHLVNCTVTAALRKYSGYNGSGFIGVFIQIGSVANNVVDVVDIEYLPKGPTLRIKQGKAE